MNKNIVLLSFIIILLIGGSIMLIAGKSQWLLSWTLGVVLGTYPFLFWGITRSFVLNNGKSSKRILLSGVLLIKFVILGAGLFLLSKIQFIIPTPFLVGLVITTPAILLPLIVDIIKNTRTLPAVSAKKY